MAFAFTEVTREEAVALCRRLAAAGARWHIHALPPGCRYNPRPEGHCFLAEDTDAGRTVAAFSSEPFTAECHELVQLLHGAAILDPAAGPAPDVPLIAAVRDADAAGEAWHHHMMAPGCVLSPDPSRHVITLERASRDEVAVHESETPPDDVLRAVELLYFARHR